MQWSADDCGGFTTADESGLPRKPLRDGPFGYPKVNVEAQREDPGSFLNWTERAIRTRKEWPEFGWGAWRLLATRTREVLAHVVTWDGGSAMAVHNFADTPGPGDRSAAGGRPQRAGRAGDTCSASGDGDAAGADERAAEHRAAALRLPLVRPARGSVRDTMRPRTIGFHASHEQFRPDRLLRLVQAAEQAGFDAAMCSDHWAPFAESQGESGFAWSWLGAAIAGDEPPVRRRQRPRPALPPRHHRPGRRHAGRHVPRPLLARRSAPGSSSTSTSPASAGRRSRAERAAARVRRRHAPPAGPARRYRTAATSPSRRPSCGRARSSRRCSSAPP